MTKAKQNKKFHIFCENGLSPSEDVTYSHLYEASTKSLAKKLIKDYVSEMENPNDLRFFVIQGTLSSVKINTKKVVSFENLK